jgi:uncharacterized membrane protein
MRSALLFILIFQILNLSVSSNDYIVGNVSINGTQSTTENHVDSFAEYISEIILKRVNSFHELRCESHKAPKHHSNSNFSFKIFSTSGSILINPLTSVHQSQFFVSQNFHYCFVKQINTPPPKDYLC